MKRIHIPSLLAATVATGASLLLITEGAPSAHAEGVIHATGSAAGSAQGPWAGRQAFNAQGDKVQAAGRRTLGSDGNGMVQGAAGSGFSTVAGGQGLRSRAFNRNSDGSVSAQGQRDLSTANGGSAQRSSSFTPSADGSSASGERSTSVTGANGTTFDGSTTYSQGSGFSRSGSCKDAAGNTVSCAPR